MAKNESWGIEVGQNAIKAIKLARSGSGVSVVDYEVMPFSKVLTTPDLNAQEAIEVALDEFMSKQDTRKTPVVISVPGHMAFARFAKLPPVEPKKIPDIVKFEAQQQIPFPMEEVEWDYQVFRDEDSPDVEVGIFAITKQRVADWLENFADVRMKIEQVTLSPLAVYNAFQFEHADSDEDVPGTIYVDIGTVSTDVIIVENGGIWMRTLPIGGNNFTEALMRAFKISFNKAEKLKREAATHKHARQIFVAMRPVFADLVQEMQRSLGYYQSLNRDAEIKQIVGLGSTFRLPGLQKFLKQQMQLKVVRPDGFERISVDGKRSSEFSDQAMNLTTAYGLAIQGLGLQSVTANVLPNRILKARMWKAKQPWIGAAAAVIALSSLLTGVKYFSDVASFKVSDPDPVSNVIALGSGMRKKFDAIQTGGQDPIQMIENYRQMLDYRTIWPCMIEDLTLAVEAMSPQAATLEADYEAMRRFNRKLRKRIYIASFKTEYIGHHEDAATLEGSFTDEIFFPDAPKEKESAYGATIPAQASTEVEDGEPAVERGPRFRVTLNGSTPNLGGASFLNDYFVKWFMENAARDDRPYTYQIDDITALKFFRRGVPVTTATEPPGIRGPRTTPRGGRRRGAGDASSSVVPSWESLLPSHPLADEDQSEDSTFTLQWEVTLVPRNRARIAAAAILPEVEPAPQTEEPSEGDAQTPTDPASTATPAESSASRDRHAPLEAMS